MTGIPASLKIDLFDRMMLRSAAENQSDGAGVTDGVRGAKSAYSYLDRGVEWLAALDPDNAWLGHVRKASQGVGGPSYQTSHPYLFANDGNSFFGVHNGFIANTGKQEKSEHPDVDSWRAMAMLEKQLKGGVVSRESVNAWLNTLFEGSQFTFAFMQHGVIRLVRGVRPLYVASWGNGFAINTSYGVVADVLEYLERRVPEFPASDIRLIPENVLITLRAGEDTYAEEELNYKLRPVTDAYVFETIYDGNKVSIDRI